MRRTSSCKDCMYSDIMDWEQDAKTGKATPIYWCEKNKKVCSTNICNVCDYYVSCDFDDLEEE